MKTTLIKSIVITTLLVVTIGTQNVFADPAAEVLQRSQQLKLIMDIIAALVLVVGGLGSAWAFFTNDQVAGKRFVNILKGAAVYGGISIIAEFFGVSSTGVF